MRVVWVWRRGVGRRAGEHVTGQRKGSPGRGEWQEAGRFRSGSSVKNSTVMLNPCVIWPHKCKVHVKYCRRRLFPAENALLPRFRQSEAIPAPPPCRSTTTKPPAGAGHESAWPPGQVDQSHQRGRIRTGGPAAGPTAGNRAWDDGETWPYRDNFRYLIRCGWSASLPFRFLKSSR